MLVPLVLLFLCPAPFETSMPDTETTENLKLDDWGIPTEFPKGLDTSLWPEKLPLKPNYDATVAWLWTTDRRVYDQYVTCLDLLIDYCVPEKGRGKHYWRRNLHHVLGQHYGCDFPPFKHPKARKDDTTDDDGGVMGCSPVHIQRLTEAAQAIEKQPDATESLNWAFEKIALVKNMGWDAIQPEDVIGVGALGLLQRGVEEPNWFYEKIAAKAFKKNETGNAGFDDDGTEQLEYAEKLAERARKAVL